MLIVIIFFYIKIITFVGSTNGDIIRVISIIFKQEVEVGFSCCTWGFVGAPPGCDASPADIYFHEFVAGKLFARYFLFGNHAQTVVTAFVKCHKPPVYLDIISL